VPVIDDIIEQEKLITGFRLFLIRQLADEVEFKKMTDQGHMVKMAINMKEQVENAEQE